jgi:hypothetical protein
MLHRRLSTGWMYLALTSSGLLLLPRSSAAQTYNISTIDVPCSACTGGIARASSAIGINPAGDIVGAYTDATGHQHGYLLSGGQFTTIDVPGKLSGVGGILPTVARGISPSGEIVGTYNAPVSTAPFGSPDFCSAAAPASCVKGYLYSHGRFSTVLYPLPSGGYHPGSVPNHFTPDGTIYGCLHDYDTGMSMFGAIWSRLGGASLLAGGGELSIMDPMAAAGVPMSMNNGATPDGRTIIGLMGSHGYIVRDGMFEQFDVTGANSTALWDINPSGAFVGVYHDTRNHAFVQFPGAPSPVLLDPVGSVGATALGINPGGVVVGTFTDSAGHGHGFVAVPQ